MKIVIVGSGMVGFSLAEKLSGQGHDVALVEVSQERARQLADALDCQVVHGNGATARTLRRAGVEGADLVVATTDVDEVNFVTGRLAASLFGVPRAVVRLRDPDHEEGFAHLAQQDPRSRHWCVNPDRAAVDKIAALLEVPGAVDVIPAMDGELLLAGFPIHRGSEFADRPVSDMRLFFAGTPSLVVALERTERALVPHGAEEIRAGDLAYFALARSDLDAFLELLDVPRDERRFVMVAGATSIGLELVRRLEASDVRVTLLESDAELARRAADKLSSASVLHGRLTHQRLLEEEEIERVSTFVAVTPDHENNLVAGLLAKRLGARRAFALVDNPALAGLIGETAVDAIISPRLLAVGLILQHAPMARLTSLAPLMGDRVEVLEAEAVKGSRIVSGKLAEVQLPRGTVVAALRRDGALRVPQGTDAVQPGDRLLIVTATGNVPKIEEFLAPR